MSVERQGLLRRRDGLPSAGVKVTLLAQPAAPVVLPKQQHRAVAGERGAEQCSQG